MAGAKETPRQKMIGMMYLVLTALLALNVSKSILDAFVAIEENIQKSNLSELFRGDERRDQIEETALDASNPVKAKKAKLLLQTVARVDEMTQKRIQLIDQLKIQILEECGEDVKAIGGKHGIVTEVYSKSMNALKPTRMNLENVDGKDKYDEAMRILIGENIKQPTGEGMKLWKSLNAYRKELTEIIAGTQLGAGDSPIFDKQYYFNAPEINAFEDQRELKTKIQAAMKKSNVHPDDESMIVEIYSSLTKEEMNTVNDIPNVHWIGKTFDHSPTVAAIASLSSLQKDILSARANALTVIRNRVGGTEFSFSTIIPLVRGPEVVNQGDDFELEVMMAVYDKDKQPEVTMDGRTIQEVKDGKGIIRMRGQNGTMNLKGTVSIQNKSGIKRTMNWEKTVTVMKPSGSIELPELNVLYRGYDNRVNASASGFPTTVLTASGATLTPGSDGNYIAKPTGSGRTANLTVSGKTVDGKTVTLKTVEYRVITLPKPTMFVGGVEDGGQIGSSERKLFTKYGNDVPLRAVFTIQSWDMTVAGAIGSEKGNGSTLSDKAMGMLKAAKSGTRVFYTLKVLGPDNVVRIVNASFTRN